MDRLDRRPWLCFKAVATRTLGRSKGASVYYINTTRPKSEGTPCYTMQLKNMFDYQDLTFSRTDPGGDVKGLMYESVSLWARCSGCKDVDRGCATALRETFSLLVEADDTEPSALNYNRITCVTLSAIDTRQENKSSHCPPLIEVLQRYTASSLSDILTLPSNLFCHLIACIFIQRHTVRHSCIRLCRDTRSG